MNLIVLFAVIACALLSKSSAAAVCSSLNGPFCMHGSAMPGILQPPPHMMDNLDQDEEDVKIADLEKRLKIEAILKQYELDSTLEEEENAQIMEELEMLLDETLKQLDVVTEDNRRIVGSFAFSNNGDTFELLERMNGKEMKEFFEQAYDEVFRSWEDVLEDIAPEIINALRVLKEVKGDDYQTYQFRYLDELARSNIRRRFENHRLIEIQKTFENVIMANNAQERHIAIETAFYIFQLCDEFAVKVDTIDATQKEGEEESKSEQETTGDTTNSQEPDS